MKKTIFISIFFLLSFQQIDNLPKYSFNKGKQYYLKGNYKLAIIELTKTINLDSSFAEAYFIRSSSYSHLMDYKNALSDLEKYIIFKPFDPEGFINLSQLRCYANVPVGSMDTTKEYNSTKMSYQIFILSLKDIDQAIKLDSLNSESYFLKAEYLSEICENHLSSSCDSIFNQAINLYTKVLKLDSSNYAAYFNRANIKLMSGDTIGACIDFHRRMNKDSNCKSALDILCEISNNEKIKKRFCSGLP
jgi:tetratricopeptide (TPR) repeat protein